MIISSTHYAHWLVPFTLSASLAVGLALALGHHYFYSTLHQRRVDETRWPQQTNNAIGTAFAFLVRSACVVAISAAYWHLFCRRLHRPLPLATIDDLADQLSAAYQLLHRQRDHHRGQDSFRIWENAGIPR